MKNLKIDLKIFKVSVNSFPKLCYLPLCRDLTKTHSDCSIDHNNLRIYKVNPIIDFPFFLSINEKLT